MWAVIRPVQAVTEDIFYSDSEATVQCELFLTAPNINILTYLQYLLNSIWHLLIELTEVLTYLSRQIYRSPAESCSCRGCRLWNFFCENYIGNSVFCLIVSEWCFTAVSVEAEVMRSGRCVGHVCLSFCLSVSRITARVTSRFHWNLVLCLGLPIETTGLLLVVNRSGIWVPSHSSLWSRGV